MEFEGYDLIGDVHGCARSLEQLLQLLGYRLRNGGYRHPSRQVVFIGDIVDRGTAVRESLQLVRTMVEQGSAQIIIGNHEYNCVTYAERAPQGSGRSYLREHNSRHKQQIHATLEQMAPYADEWRDYLCWFRQLPLYLEFPHFRAVHACWDQALISQLQTLGINDLSDDGFLQRSVERDSFEWTVTDSLLRGTHMMLPNNEVMQTVEGFNRHVYRTKFWEPHPLRHQDVVFQPDPLPEHIARQRLTAAEHKRLRHYGPEQLPLFIGHYWCQGQPLPITDNIVCLDYSAVKSGKLVAYRMDQESRLDAAKFVWVDVDPADVGE
ncbi:MAG: hypothetical protein ACI9W6_002133 [Motiliproteus sp.]